MGINWAGLGHSLGQSFNQGFNQGIANTLALQQDVMKQKLANKYAGQQASEMLKKKLQEEDPVLHTMNFLQNQNKLRSFGDNLLKRMDTDTALDKANTVLDENNTMLSQLNKPTENKIGEYLQNNIYGAKGKNDFNNYILKSMLGDNISLDDVVNAEQYQVATEPDNQSGNGLLSLMTGTSKDYNDVIESMKKQVAQDIFSDEYDRKYGADEKKLIDLARGGNTYAIKKIKDIIDPEKPNWQLRSYKGFDPRRNMFTETDETYYIDPKTGKKITGSTDTRDTKKDWTLDELNNRRAIAYGRGSGSGNDNEKGALTADQFNKLLDEYDFSNNPELKYITANMRTEDKSTYIKPVLSTLSPPEKIPEKPIISNPFGKSYEEQVKEVKARNKEREIGRQYLIKNYNYDPYIVYANEGVEKLKAQGVGFTKDDNGQIYIIVGNQRKPVTIDELINYGLE